MLGSKVSTCAKYEFNCDDNVTVDAPIIQEGQNKK